MAARAGRLRPRDRLAHTLAILVLLTQAVLAFILRSFGGAGVSVAFFLASVIVSPLLFIGAALLYVDQAARVQVE